MRNLKGNLPYIIVSVVLCGSSGQNYSDIYSKTFETWI